MRPKVRAAEIERDTKLKLADKENERAEGMKEISAQLVSLQEKMLQVAEKILNQYEKDSPAYQLYFAQIQNDMTRQSNFIEQQLQAVSERQNLVLQSFLSSKEKILDQTAQITETITQKLLTEKIQTLPPPQEIKALPAAN